MKLTYPLEKEYPLLESNLFGANPQNYKKFGLAGHDGIDILCPEGTKVRSPISGITYVGWDPKGWGLYIRITNDECTVYLCHLSEHIVSSDTKVDLNTVIGLSGSTGNSSGPHLHVALRVKSVSNPPMKDFVNPLDYIETDQGGESMDPEIVKRADAFVAVCEKLGKAVDKDVVLADLDRLIKLEDILKDRDKELTKKDEALAKLDERVEKLTQDNNELMTKTETLTKQCEDQAKDLESISRTIEVLKKTKPITDYTAAELFARGIKKIFGG